MRTLLINSHFYHLKVCPFYLFHLWWNKNVGSSISKHVSLENLFIPFQTFIHSDLYTTFIIKVNVWIVHFRISAILYKHFHHKETLLITDLYKCNIVGEGCSTTPQTAVSDPVQMCTCGSSQVMGTADVTSAFNSAQQSELAPSTARVSQKCSSQ